MKATAPFRPVKRAIHPLEQLRAQHDRMQQELHDLYLMSVLSKIEEVQREVDAQAAEARQRLRGPQYSKGMRKFTVALVTGKGFVSFLNKRADELTRKRLRLLDYFSREYAKTGLPSDKAEELAKRHNLPLFELNSQLSRAKFTLDEVSDAAEVAFYKTPMDAAYERLFV